MQKYIELTTETYIEAFKIYGIKIQGGTIHQFLKDSMVEYHPGKCPIYLVVYLHSGKRVVIGGNYASNRKPILQPLERLDFLTETQEVKNGVYTGVKHGGIKHFKANSLGA